MQPDPVGADGNHFFRGFFNLLLCVYRYVSGDDKHYMSMDRKGNLDWFAFYYDPLEKSLCSFRDDVAAYGALCITQYVYPQDKAAAPVAARRDRGAR